MSKESGSGRRPHPLDFSSDSDEGQGHLVGWKRPKMLGHLLYDSAKDSSSATTDLVVYLGPGRSSQEERTFVRGHVAVFSAMSQVFATQLNSTCWNTNRDKEGQQKKVIELPEDVSEASGRAFVKYLYTEELTLEDMDGSSTPMTTEDGRSIYGNITNRCAFILDVMALADMYLVQGLLKACDNFLCARIFTDNCVSIYETTKRFSAVTRVGGKAYKLIKRRIQDMTTEIISGSNAQANSYWEVETWRTLLKEDYLVVKEIDLFRAVLAWKNADEPLRLEAFKELIQLIRYPLMSPEDFSKFVVPTKLLSSEDVVKIFMLIHRESTDLTEAGPSENDTELRFCTRNRRGRVASDSAMLKKLLQNATPHDVIFLREGVTYEGNFILAKSHVTLKGSCPERKSILKSIPNFNFSNPSTVHPHPDTLHIIADSCSLENITILSCSPLTGIKRPTLSVHGSENSFKNIEIGVYDPTSTPQTGKDELLKLEVKMGKGSDQVALSPSLSPIVGRRDPSPDLSSPTSSLNSFDQEELSPSPGSRVIEAGFVEGFFRHGILIVGESNECTKLLITSHSEGIHIKGGDNCLSEVEIRDCNVGIRIGGNNNRLSSIVLKNIGRIGIDIHGGQSRVKIVQIIQSVVTVRTPSGPNMGEWPEKVMAVSMTGNRHVVKDVLCEGLEERHAWALYMVGTTNCFIRNCGPGQVTVRGSNNTLNNVKASASLRVFGNGHTFVGCEANEINFPDGIEARDNLVIRECQFSSWV